MSLLWNNLAVLRLYEFKNKYSCSTEYGIIPSLLPHHHRFNQRCSLPERYWAPPQTRSFLIQFASFYTSPFSARRDRLWRGYTQQPNFPNFNPYVSAFYAFSLNPTRLPRLPRRILGLLCTSWLPVYMMHFSNTHTHVTSLFVCKYWVTRAAKHDMASWHIWGKICVSGLRCFFFFMDGAGKRAHYSPDPYTY